MNRHVFALVAGYFSAMVAINGANAQSSVNTEKLQYQDDIAEIEKVTGPVKNQSDDLGEINPRVLKKFAQTYKEVKADSWEKIKDGFAARFVKDDVTNKVYYYPGGKWAASLKSYSEMKLPHEVRDIVKRVYYDFAITYVQELETIYSDGIPTYIITLEDDKSIKQVSVYDGSMELRKEFKKS